MYSKLPGHLKPTARPIAAASRGLPRPRLICHAAAPAPAAPAPAAPAPTSLASASGGPEMFVRLAQPEDTHNIVHLTRELAQETEALDLPLQQVTEGVNTLITDPSKGRAFVIEAKGQVVAQMQIIYEWSDWRNTNMWWITSLFVDSEYRRRGCFKMLYDHARSAALREGVAGIRVYTVNDNLAAQETYEAVGMSCHHKVYQEDLK